MTTILYFFWDGFGGDVAVVTPEPVRTTRRDPSQVTRARSELSNTPNLPTRKATVER